MNKQGFILMGCKAEIELLSNYQYLWFQTRVCQRFVMKFCSQDTKIKWKFKAALNITLSKNEGLRDIGNSMSMVLDSKKDVFRNQQSVHWFIMAVITKGDKNYFKICQDFYYKIHCFFTKCGSYLKVCQFYYKLRQSLQNVTFITISVSAKSYWL